MMIVSSGTKCRNRHTKGEYLLRCLVSCRRCGLAYRVQSNGRYPYSSCRGGDTLVARHRPEVCCAQKVPADRLDAAVWEDLCQALTDPAVLDEALHRAQQGGLKPDERTARRQDLRRQQGDVQRQIGRLIDAYMAEVITLEELEARRGKLEERLRVLRQEEQGLDVEEDHRGAYRHRAHPPCARRMTRSGEGECTTAA